MDILNHNREAWNRQSLAGSRWCEPVTAAEIDSAKRGEWRVILTPNRPVPGEWLGDVRGKQVLGLASGGGQQVPILAAAGASVTSFDNSDEQLAKDLLVTGREDLKIATVRGDMADLSAFDDASFDLIFHPVSNCFAAKIRPVWKECYRVLKPGGRLLSGFMNPVFFLFDDQEEGESEALQVKYTMPFSDLECVSEERRQQLKDRGEAFEFGHSLEDQLGGQIEAGFVITGFYEDSWEDDATPLNQYMPVMMATMAVRS